MTIYNEIFDYILHSFFIFVIVLFAPKIISYIFSLLIRPCKKSLLRPKPNDWAIITGATDGIGLEYARQFAKKGYHLLLLSRTESKLEKVRKEIIEKHNVDIEFLAVDFTRIDIYTSIKEKIESIDGRMSILVNNVGMFNSLPYEFADIDEENVNTNILICNTYSVTKMCEILLRIMKSQKHGIIINVSSSIALVPNPMFSLYGATKTFVSTLSSCLAAEYGQYGIIIQDVTPNQVSTNMTKEIVMNFIAVDTKSYVKYALNALGKEQQTSAHPKHKFINNMSQLICFWLPECITMRIRYLFAKNLRQKALNNNIF